MIPIQKEKRFFLRTEMYTISLKMRADHAVRGEKVAQTSLSEAQSELGCSLPTELFMNRVSSFILRGWNFTKRIN